MTTNQPKHSTKGALMELSLRGFVWISSLIRSLSGSDEAGEGVISTAMAVYR